MRTYLILKEKVKRFGEDKEIQALLAGIREAHGEPAATALQPRRGRRAEGALVRPRALASTGSAVRAAGSADDRLADGRSVIADCRLQIADCRLQIADCRLQIVDCGLPIAD